MSVSIVDQTTGLASKVAGNVNDKIGNLSSLTTNNKSSCVDAINEIKNDLTNKVDQITLGLITGANDLSEFVLAVINTISSHVVDEKLTVVYAIYQGHDYYTFYVMRLYDDVYTFTANDAATAYNGKVIANQNYVEIKEINSKHAITFTANTGYTIEDKGSYVIGNVAYLNFFIKSSTLITSSRVHVGRMNIKVPVGNTIAVTCPSARVIDSTLNGFANVILGLSVSSSGSSIIVGDYVTQQDGCTQVCVNCSIVIS